MRSNPHEHPEGYAQDLLDDLFKGIRLNDLERKWDAALTLMRWLEGGGALPVGFCPRHKGADTTEHRLILHGFCHFHLHAVLNDPDAPEANFLPREKT